MVLIHQLINNIHIFIEVYTNKLLDFSQYTFLNSTKSVATVKPCAKPHTNIE